MASELNRVASFDRASLTLIGMRGDTFISLSSLSVSDFVTWIFIKIFQTFLEVKIEINRVNLTPFWAHWVL